jgi:hypothetical protein
MFCLDAASKAHLGLDHLQARLETDASKVATGQLTWINRRSGRRDSAGLRNGKRHSAGLTRLRIESLSTSVSATLIGCFNGRVIRNVSCTHWPLDGT